METPSIDQKLLTILKNIAQFPTIYHSQIEALKNKQPGQQIDELDYIKIETYYKVIQPAMYSLHWQKPNEEINYPVTGVIVDRNNQLGAYGIGVEIATWIQSGGTRCIPIKSNISEIQTQQFIKMTHCAIFIQSCTQTEHYQQFIKKYLKIASQQHHYPILFLGRSCLFGIDSLPNSKIFIEDKIQNTLSEIYIKHDSQLFKDLDLGLRFQIENTKKVRYPHLRLPNNHINTGTGMQVKGYMKIKNQIIVSVIEYNEKNRYFLFNQSTNFENTQSIQLWHCAISNFIDIVKGYKKDINQKKVQKTLLAHHSIVYQSDKGFYKIC